MRFTMTHQNTKPFTGKPLRKSYDPLTLCDVDNCTNEATQQHGYIAQAHTMFGITQDGERAYMYTCAGHSGKAQSLADHYAKKWLS